MAALESLWIEDPYSQKTSMVINAVLEIMSPGLRGKGVDIMYNTPLVHGGLTYKNECVHYLFLEKEEPPSNKYVKPACSSYEERELILMDNDNKWAFSQFSNKSLEEYGATLRRIVLEKMAKIDESALSK